MKDFVLFQKESFKDFLQLNKFHRQNSNESRDQYVKKKRNS